MVSKICVAEKNHLMVIQGHFARFVNDIKKHDFGTQHKQFRNQVS
jgi:hypothetical protein